MAVAFDAVTTQAGVATNFNHTPVGTPTAAVFTAHWRGNADATSDLTGVTYGGVAMTEEAYIDHYGNTSGPGGTGVDVCQVWTLANPSAGVQAVAITRAGSAALYEVYTLTTVTGSATSGAFGTPVTSYQSSNASADTGDGLTVSSETDGLVIDALSTQETEDHTVVAGQTERWDLSDGSLQRGCGSTKPGATSVNVGWTWITNTRYAYIGIGIVPPAGAAQAPAAPTACNAVASGDSITATFTDNTSGAAQHRAYIKRTTDSTWEWSGDLDAGVTTFTFEWLTPGTAYDVGYTAFDADAESAMTTDTTTETESVRLVSGSFL